MHAVTFVAHFCSLIVRSSDVFDRLRACSGETVRKTELSGDGGRDKFSLLIIELVYANGGKADWCGDAVPEERGWRVCE